MSHDRYKFSLTINSHDTAPTVSSFSAHPKDTRDADKIANFLNYPEYSKLKFVYKEPILIRISSSAVSMSSILSSIISFEELGSVLEFPRVVVILSSASELSLSKLSELVAKLWIVLLRDPDLFLRVSTSKSSALKPFTLRSAARAS